MWTCAAFAGPVRPLNVSRQARTAPVADRVTVAVNVPRAPPTSPVGVGTSWAEFKAAATLIVVTWPCATPAPATTTRGRA